MRKAHNSKLNIQQLQRYNLAQAMSRVKGKFNIKKQMKLSIRKVDTKGLRQKSINNINTNNICVILKTLKSQWQVQATLD